MPLDVDLRRRLRCPAATLVEHTTEGPSVQCGVIEQANRREPVSAEASALVSGRTSAPTIAMFCAGQGQAGMPRPAEHFEELRGKLSIEEAGQTFSFTDCPVWQDEQDRLERVKRAGQAARLEAAGVERVEHDTIPVEDMRARISIGPADRPDGPSPRGAP